MSDLYSYLARSNFRKALNIEWSTGIAGDGNGVINDPFWIGSGRVYVRFLTDNGYSTPTLIRGPSRQLAVALTDNLPVKIKYENDEPYIDDVNGPAAVIAGTYPVQNPPSAIGNGDGSTQDQLSTLRCSQNTDQPSLIVHLNGWVPVVNGVAYNFPGDDIELTSFLPTTGNHRLVGIFVKDDYSTTEVFGSTETPLVNPLTVETDLNEVLALASSGSTIAWTYDLRADVDTVLDTDTFLDARQLVNNAQSSATGDVSGPASATDNAVARFDGATGKQIQNSGVLIDDNGNLTANEYKLNAAVNSTLSSDAFTVSSGYHILESESGPSDNLATINGGSGRQDLTIQADSDDTITVKNGTGNIFLNSGADFALSGDKTLRLFYDGTNWSDLGAGTSATGDVVGPASATDSDFAQFNGTTGKLIKDGGLSLDTDGTFAANSDSRIPSQKATKSYVDAVATGLSPKQSVVVATTAALPTNTYSNGASGVGATLTAVATGVLTVDGHNVAINERVLVKDEAAASHNGIYLCTVAGAIGVAYVLTRTTDNDTSAEIIGSFVFVETGTVNVSSGWVNTNSTTITIGTTAINFTQFSQGSGDVSGPSSSTDNALARFDSTTGKIIQNGVVTEDDSGNLDSHDHALLETTFTEVKEGSTPSSPASGYQRAFIDSTKHHLERVNSSGVVTDLEINPGVYADVAGSVTVASPGATIDGVSMSAGQIVLKTDNSADSGLWVWNGAAVPMTRPANYPTGSNTLAISGMLIRILSGTLYTGAVFTIATLGTITIDTTTVQWTQLAAWLVQILTGNLIQFGAIQEITVGIGDDLTATVNNISVKARTGTTDDLATININGTKPYVVYLQAKSGHTITVKHNTGNILLIAAADYALTGNAVLVLYYNDSTSKWYDTMTPHTHQDAANGGSLDGAAVTSGTVAAARLGVGTGDSGSGGVKGAVPAPATGDAIKGFFGDFTYAGTLRDLASSFLGGDAANFDLTSIPTTYKHLVLYLFLRSDRAATIDNVYIRFNNDSTAANYYSWSNSQNGTTPTNSVLERLGATATGIEVNTGAVGNTGPSNEFSVLRIEIFNYASTSANRAVNFEAFVRSGTTTGNLRKAYGGGSWVNAANAINRITVLPVTGTNWKSDSGYLLFGVS